MDLPQLTVPAPPQGSSPQADHLSNFGSQMLLASNSIQRASDLLVSVSLGAEMNRIKTTELASQAMEELKKLALAREPLWQVDMENNTEILSGIEYTREFGDISTTLTEIVRMVEVRESQSLPNLDLNNSEYSVGSNEHRPRELGGPKPASFEASREIGFVQMNPASIIEMLMDLGQWSQAFSTIVSRASIMGVLSSTGVQGNYDGTLQVMSAEFQAPAPLIPTRESYFASSGFAFSAKRWVATLIGQCQWLETLTATRTTLAADGADVSSQGRRSLLKLSERMVRSFYIDNISGSAENKWMPLPLGWPVSGAENVRISMKSSTDDPGKPPGSTVVFTTSINLPFPRKQLFSFLREEKCRNEWDMLASNHGFDEYAYFANGKTPGNRVSILRAFKSNEVGIFYLQASYTDTTGSYVVYAPIDMYAMTELINGGNPDNLAILASGFSILPDKPMHRDDTGGSLLTIAFHVAAGTSTQEHVFAHQHANLMYCVLASTVVSVEERLQST
ncbi:homeobox-leucine zipper protein MERISTEM L1-like [Pyrus x bretschneideri]|uniref:homeobox-leucine zipper protein MERISTEM L1-like n=1 Tax=Pyrus x bretschneideri TaxID=225117 RepID=UPI00202FF0C1|nr:homeobox-leucine zipper protein MERISTEM L1-like [Pyrus x bretschneideri]